MSKFSEYFTEIKNKRNITSAEIAKKCNMDRTVLFHWMTGQYMPSKWKKIEKILEILQLSTHEYKKLKEAYEREKMGDDIYESIKKIKEIIHIIEHKSNINDRNISPVYYDVKEPMMSEDMELKNYLDVLQCIQNIFDMYAYQKERTLYLKVDYISEKFYVILNLFCNKHLGKLELLVNMAENENQFLNLDLLKSSIELFLSKSSVNVYGGELYSWEQTGENWILSDDFVLQFSQDMSYGIFSRNKEYINFIWNKYLGFRKICKDLFHNNMDYYEDFMKIYGDEIELYCMENMPCISKGLTIEILRKYIHEGVFQKELIIQNVINELVETKAVKEVYSIYNEDGLYSFLETGRFENFPYDMYKEINMGDRCEILRNALENRTSPVTVHYYRMKHKLFPPNMYIEYQNKKEISEVCFRIFQNNTEKQIEIRNQTVVNAFKNFIDYCLDIENDYVYSEEETREFMYQVLEEYERKCI